MLTRGLWLALVLVGAIALPAHAQTAISLRLHEAVVAVCPSVVGLSIGTPGVAASVTVQPAAQQACAQATINAFDWSAGAQTSYENLRARTLAKAQWASATELGKALRCFADILKDEINLLRGVVIGTQTAVWDPASMNNATGVTSPNVTVTGAAFGDIVDVIAPYTLAGVTATGYISAANTVNVRLHNGTGAVANPASGTWAVVVRRQPAMAPRTLAQLRTSIDACVDAGAQD